MADNPSVTILAMVEAGSKYESKKDNGLSHFLEHMLFKGTPRRPKASDISRELDSIGANYNAFTGQECTGYYAKADARHLDKIIDVVSDLYLNPLFDQNEMQKEKGVIVEEIRMYKDLPQQHVQDVIMELIYGDQPVGWNIAGTEENVRAFTREQLLTYRNANYVAKATVVMIAGSFDEKEVLKKISKVFSVIPDAAKSSKLKVKESQKSPQIKIEAKETDQAHIVIGQRTFSVHDKRIPTMDVLATILGHGMSSRLFSKMRDELGICYYIKAEHNAFTDHGFFAISAGLDNTRIEIGIKNIILECERLKNESVSDAELKKVKDYIAGTTMLGLETSDARAMFCGDQEVIRGKIESPADIIAKINAVTAKDVQKLAKEIFVNEGLNLAVVGRFKDSEEVREYFRFK